MDRPRLSRFVPLIVSTIVLAILALYSWKKLEVTSDITHFLPDGRDKRLSELSRGLADSDLARTMIVSVEAPDEKIAAEATKMLGADLAKDRDVAWIRGGVDEAAQKDVYDAYFSRRFLFASDRPIDLPSHLTDAALRESARDLKRELASPIGPLVRTIAPRDPLLLFPKFLERLRVAQDDALHLVGDQFVSADGRHGVIFLGTRAAPFDSEGQARFLGSLDAAFATINAHYNHVLRLESSGIGRFNVSAEKSIRADIQRISIISTIGVIVLFLIVFRSIRYVLLGMIPLVAGTICAIAAGIAIFGKIHGLTLAFGSSLIGVGIDYAEHYFSHHTVTPDPNGPEASIRRIWPGLVIGALTTIAGLAGLAWTSFPGLREIAVFSTVGVLAALVSTRIFLPPLMPWRPRPVPLQQWAARNLGQVLAAMMRARRGLLVLPIVGIVFCAIGLPRLRWVDDISALNSIDPALEAEDLRVRERVAHADPGRFVLVVGDDDDHALAKNDEVALRLDRARVDGILESFHSAHSVIWSKALQTQSSNAFTRDASLAARVSSAFQSEGFVPSAFEPFDHDLAQKQPDPLTMSDLLASPLADLVRPLRVAVGGRIALVTSVAGVKDGDALAARLRDLDDVYYLDQRTFFDEAYGRFRTRTLEMIGVGLFVVFLIVHVRYRKIRLSLAAFLPSVLAAGATLSYLALRGSPLNLMHVVGVLLVLSMGVDYGVFVVESRDHPEELGATLLSLVTAMLSTVLSFGLLGMSQNPALRALGVTAGLGTFLSVIFAPAALVLLHATEKKR